MARSAKAQWPSARWAIVIGGSEAIDQKLANTSRTSG
jgi:hypothetical protein